MSVNSYICFMYIPAAFQVTDPAVISSFLTEHPFGTLVSSGTDGFPVSAHLPFLLKEDASNLYVEVHLANVNELASTLKDGSKATMMVSGARGYVSSSVYTHMNVPTYNYEAVHLSGEISVMDKDELLQHLKEVVANFEADRDHPIDFDQWPERMITGYMTEITGLRLRVQKTEAAFKLSQNRNQIDFIRIVDDLKKGTIHQQLLAEAMLNIKK